ncbi:MAG: hypothetical protein ACI4B3_00665 [Prevotella sp.]
MANIIQEGRQSLGTFAGSVLAQASAEIGGWRHVFYLPQGPRPAPQYPMHGGILVNPFKGHGKIFAGDLIEHTLDGKCKLLKTYEVAKQSTGTTIYISSGATENGQIFRHIPFVGDILMVAPEAIDGEGTGVTVTAVEITKDEKGKQDGWKITVSATLGSLEAGAVLVEATKAGADATAVVTNPNCYAEVDYDCPFIPATGDADFDGARYFLTPTMMRGVELAYIDRMQPLPASIKNMEKFKSGYKELMRL